MNAAGLLSGLAARGVDLSADGDRPRCRAPEGALTGARLPVHCLTERRHTRPSRATRQLTEDP